MQQILINGAWRDARTKATRHFFAPTRLTEVRHGTLPTREEIFGPVLAVTVVEDADEAIRLADDSEFGLGASIYTGPCGGMRHSGVGPELGAEGSDAFRDPTHVHLDSVRERKAWWYPYRNRRAPSGDAPR